MKKTVLLIMFITALSINLFANGVGIVDAENGIFLKMISSSVEVSVENQIALVKTTQTFKNNFTYPQEMKYGFPMPEDGSALSLRWNNNDQWYTAEFAAVPQDTSAVSGDIAPNLDEYLGETPLFFNDIGDVGPGESVIVELTYVQLLPYAFGDVTFSYPNDYSLISMLPLETMEFYFTLSSSRTIENAEMENYTPDMSYNDGVNCEIQYSSENESPNADYVVIYSLSPEELGVLTMSTKLEHSLVPDAFGDGYFVFIAEPDPSEAIDYINKYFTLVIDRSGSMSGDKIVQARNAASYIVNHLNEGDKFNLVSFSSDITSLWEAHMDFNPSNQDEALNYISNIDAYGMTNISGAFSEAVPQFSQSSENTANIIIFLTDGIPTTGITSTENLVNHINDLVDQTETDLMINTFGIGGDVNKQLLNLIAAENQGICQFLEDNELEETITHFYNQIRYPVLLDTEISFSSASVNEVYPNPLPNLYKGQQLIAAARYENEESVTMTLSGTAFGLPVSYDFDINLSGESNENYSFLPKVWAKKKIEYLLIEYYSYDEDSSIAHEIKDEIINLSMLYGVMSPFTSFDGPTGIEEEEENLPIAKAFELIGNAPNPFNPSTVISFKVKADIHRTVKIKIYNTIGQLITVLDVDVNGEGIYKAYWNGTDSKGITASAGQYFYIIDCGDALLSGKMLLVK